jgi:hypothetical protein
MRDKALKNFEVLFDKSMKDINDIFKTKAGEKISAFDKYKKKQSTERGFSHMVDVDHHMLNLVENEREAKELRDPNSLNNSDGAYNESRFRLKENEGILKKSAFKGLNLDLRRDREDDFINDSY